MKVSIIIPVLNQLALTKICLESLIKNTWDIEHEIIVIDNASTDSTSAYLKENGIFCLANRENLGVAKAWNQGIKASNGEYVCVINNDIVAAGGWLSNLVEFYESCPDSGIVSPGTRWGELDYDFDSYAANYMKKMKEISKDGYAGWCMLIKRDRFEKTGYFCEDYRVGTCEDTDYYYALKKAGFKSRITGCSFVHHFGSRTLKAMRANVKGFEDENTEKLRVKWQIKPETYLERKKKSFKKFTENILLKVMRGHTLDERRPG